MKWMIFDHKTRMKAILPSEASRKYIKKQTLLIIKPLKCTIGKDL